MADLSVLTDLVRVDIPVAPKVVIQSALIRVLREFCEETRTSTHKSSLYLPAGLNRADIDCPSHYEVVEVTAVTKDGRAIELLSSLPANPSGEPNAAAVSTEDGYALEFDGFPAEKIQFEVCMDCKPKLGATKVDDFLVGQWGEQIAYGAIAYLMLQPGKPWSQPEYGQMFEGKYRDAIAKARVKKNKGMAQSKQTVQYRKWV